MMDRLLTLPWDRLTPQEQRLALVAAERVGEELAASLDGRYVDEWRERLAERLTDNPELSPEYVIYLDFAVERARAQRQMTYDEVAYWQNHRSRRDPRVATFAHSWWKRVVYALPVMTGGLRSR